MFERQSGMIASLSAGMAAFLLSGCAALRLYDENKAKMSASVKEEYTRADVLGVIEVEKTNLDNLLAEELKVVRDNYKLQVDFALLRIADDNTPMADMYKTKGLERLNKLGYPGGLKQLRKALLAEVDIAEGQSALLEDAQLIENIVHLKPPPCEAQKLPETMPLPDSATPENRKRAESFYDRYRKQCHELQRSGSQPVAGETGRALEEWQRAKQETTKLDQTVGQAEKEVQAKTEAYDLAKKKVEEAGSIGPKEKKSLEEKAAALAKDLESARDIAGLLGAEKAATERLNSIVVVLAAAAGEKIDTADPKIAKAATVAQQIPSLAGDMAALLKQARIPSVNNLLIEMRHQVLLLEYGKQLKSLAQQRVDILKTQYDALKKEAGFWLNFGDAVCSYAVLSGGKPFPGKSCDDFSVVIDESKKTWNCSVSNSQIENCVLGKPWHENIQSQANPGATRELYKALAAYLQALALRGAQHEQTFRLIDVRHRESLASRESAIRGWDNLVSVPVSQLEAYYQAGLKPAEIADLIVKALGFTAIAVGVAQ